MNRLVSRRRGPLGAALLSLAVLQALLLQAPSAAGAETAPAAADAAAAAAPAEAAPADDELQFYKRLYDFGIGKRAYSYVSEYKRLPVYNFGLGKRAGGRQYEFGLGKRALMPYELGWAAPKNEDYEEEENDDEAPEDGFDESEDLDNRDFYPIGKRSRPFGFGLGKRAGMYSFGLGKRGHHMFNFGLGKRGDGRMYSFGLGKRPNMDRMSGSRFNFGLGKRDSTYPFDDIDAEKRAPDHRFAFGLGKREVSPKELEAVKDEQDAQHPVHEKAALPKEDSGAKHVVKRSLHYGFGIGKRTNDPYGLDLEPDEDDGATAVEDFARYVRRPYSFGLGKRVPMYDFGIGKRAER